MKRKRLSESMMIDKVMFGGEAISERAKGSDSAALGPVVRRLGADESEHSLAVAGFLFVYCSFSILT